jgi:transposase
VKIVLAGRIVTMPRPYPQEFRDDVVAVAGGGEGPLTQIAKGFEIFKRRLRNWMKEAAPSSGCRSP